MYNSGYSQASKFNLQAQKKMKQRQKGKSCGYYMRIIFFFSSLIQSLIIVSLVLFLVYGKQTDSPSATRIQDLERSFSKLSMENVDLRQQRKNLTQVLNVTLTEKMWNDRLLLQLRYLSNTSYTILRDLNTKLTFSNMELHKCKLSPSTTSQCSTGSRPPVLNTFGVGGDKGCETRLQHLTAMIQMVQSNFTQTSQMARMEMEQIAKERDNINLDAIRLRRDKATLERELAAYKVMCKDEFAQSLSGISNVSRAFLAKIDSLFPHHISFQLTCVKQRENLEQIRSNCTSLSREVEDKFQRYLDNVGAQVSQIREESSRLKAETLMLREDYSWCSQNRTGLIQEHRQNTQKLQLNCDQAKEKLLMEKKRLSGDKELKDINLKVKDGEIQHCKDQLKQLNASCARKGGLPGGSGATSGTSFGTGGLGQSGSPWNKLWGSSSSSSAAGNAFGRTGSSFGSTGSNTGLGSNGFGLNKPASGGIGSSIFGSTGLNSRSAGSNQGVGSTGLGSSKPGVTGIGSSKPSTGSSFGSTLGSTGLGQSKPSLWGIGSSGSGSNRSSSTIGSTGPGSSKPGSNGLGTSSLGSTGLGSTGSGAGKKPGSGLGLGTGLGSTGLGNTGVGSMGPGNTGLGNTGLGSNSLGSTRVGSTGLGGTGGLGSTGRTGTGGTGLGSWPGTGTGTGLGSSSTGLGGLGTGSTGLGNKGGTGLGSTGTGGWNTGGGTGTSGLGNKGSTGVGSTGTGGWGSMGGNAFKGLGSSSTGLGSTGLGTGGLGKGTGGLGSFGGTGSSSAGGLGGSGTVNILQHLQDLQRFANLQIVPEEKKKDQFRMFGG